MIKTQVEKTLFLHMQNLVFETGNASENATGGVGRSPWGCRSPAFTRLNISRWNYPIPVGFVLAWTSIYGLALRVNSAGMKHFHPDTFHLANGIM